MRFEHISVIYFRVLLIIPSKINYFFFNYFSRLNLEVLGLNKVCIKLSCMS